MILLLFSVLPLWATHQRAAEITYEWKGGNVYEFTLTCYTYTPSPAGLQRDSLPILWGDGFYDYVPRVIMEDLGDDYTLNVYRMVHEYSSAGTYVISMEDPDRNYGVVNVPNSVSIPMYIETELVISPFLGYNNSVQLLNRPVDKGCVGKPFYHNPAAYDADGDSLSYRLVPCKGTGGEDIPGYTYPQSSSLFEIDPVTGELRWENPVLQGEYNIAILIEEWRHGVKIGAVTRDMQVLINACNNNNPNIDCPGSTCVVAGNTLEFPISGSDPDGDNVTLTASGGPFEVSECPAVLVPPTASGLNPMMSFSWSTSCTHIRKAPYQVVVHATDDSFPIPLSNVRTIDIAVLGPAVDSLAAELVGTTASLTWAPYACPNAEKLRVYRKVGSLPYDPDPCETGVRPGYQLMAELAPDATSFDDDNGGLGFDQGVDYCYRVVAVFHDDYESVPSEEVCIRQKNSLPLMTLVTNDSVDLSLGRLVVRWAEPRELEPQYQGPYTYTLLRTREGTETTVYTGPDTLYLDADVDLAQVQSLRYRVEMRDASQQLVGVSTPAEPVFLAGAGGDGKSLLSWTEAVPWIVDSTQVFKEVTIDQARRAKGSAAVQGSAFVKVASTTAMSYTDLEVENGTPYRYYVRTFGHYGVESLPRPLVNYSAIVTVTPDDNEPPAPLQLSVETDCDNEQNIVSWHGGGEDDLAGYKIYYNATSTGEYTLVATIENPGDTLYLHAELQSTLSCYYMVAFDAEGNCSQPSDTLCVDMDDCPAYELPNVFTPNGDGFNDVFVPIHVSKLVDHVAMHIFNRWGRPVYDTTDPHISWDGNASGSR
ncbi:MAG: gliding motility-associated C-terminal domain-containing protein, partial [Bacteroidales bacterium]|nr:gliding motility-associated C-terminal domain-containing protein [Bacteroidales bacterium]